VSWCMLHAAHSRKACWLETCKPSGKVPPAPIHKFSLIVACSITSPVTAVALQTTPAAASSPSGSGLSAGQTAGIVLGVLFGALAIAGIITGIVMCKRGSVSAASRLPDVGRGAPSHSRASAYQPPPLTAVRAPGSLEHSSPSPTRSPRSFTNPAHEFGGDAQQQGARPGSPRQWHMRVDFDGLGGAAGAGAGVSHLGGGRSGSPVQGLGSQPQI